MMKKKVLILLIASFLLFSIISTTLVFAGLEIKKEPVVDVVIPEVNEPAIYKLRIKNLGPTDNFKVYSLVGVEIKPSEAFSIRQGETKELEIELWPGQAILKTPGTFNFVYKIKSSESIQDDVMLIKIVPLKDALEINSYNINLESDKAVVYVRNKVSLPFPEVRARFHSSFFDFSETFSLEPYEKKEFEITLNKEGIKKLTAGTYSITTEIETYNTEETIENSFKFTEKADISTEKIKTGILISKLTVKKINEGNLPTLVQTKVKKNIISRLFTIFNEDPAAVQRRGFVVEYTFQKEIRPAETYTIKVTTNWLYPLFLLVAIIIIGFLVRAYTSTFLILKKKATFVKTKGGEFALKITLMVKAKKFVEKINVIDKIPGLVKVHERFGIVEPDKIDEKNRRLEWHVESLQPDEERVFSYVIYSKVSPIGKFELPTATAVYEREGKIHETKSNKVFFLTEPRKKS